MKSETRQIVGDGLIVSVMTIVLFRVLSWGLVKYISQDFQPVTLAAMICGILLFIGSIIDPDEMCRFGYAYTSATMGVYSVMLAVTENAYPLGQSVVFAIAIILAIVLIFRAWWQVIPHFVVYNFPVSVRRNFYRIVVGQTVLLLVLLALLDFFFPN